MTNEIGRQGEKDLGNGLRRNKRKETGNEVGIIERRMTKIKTKGKT